MVKSPPAASIAAPIPDRTSCCSSGGIWEWAERGDLFQPFVAGVMALPVEAPLFGCAERLRLPHAVGRFVAQHRVRVRGNGRWKMGVGQDAAIDRGEGFPRPDGSRNAFQNTARRPPGRRACAALAAPATGSTQCQACPAMTVSKVRPGPSPRSSRPRSRCRCAAPGLPCARPARRRARGSRCPELAGRDARPAADVEDVRPGGGEPLDEGVRIAWPGPVVAVGVRAERLRHVPLVMRLVRESGHVPTIVGKRPLG